MRGAHISDRGYDLGQILDTPMASVISFKVSLDVTGTTSGMTRQTVELHQDKRKGGLLQAT